MEKRRGLLGVTRERMRVRHLSLRTEQAYLQWLRRYVAFHGRKHPREVGAAGVEQFLTHLAVVRKVSAVTQNQALQALLFLHRHVLGIELPRLNIAHAAPSRRLPVVLSRGEVRSLLSQLDGLPWLVASLLYGSGLRLMEGLRLRVKDLVSGPERAHRPPGQGRARPRHHVARDAAAAVADSPREAALLV